MKGETSTGHEAEAQQRFDEWSESSTFKRLRSWLSFVQSQALEEIDWARAQTILDVGCGSGWAVYQSAHRLAANGSGIACGCDLSLGMLQQRGRAPSQLKAHFSAASAQDLPFQDSCFDALLCTVAFHHFPEPDKALREFNRVLCPGGKVVIADSFRDLSWGLWLWDHLHRWFEPGHVRYYRIEELQNLLDAAGFAELETRELRPTFSQSRKLFRNSGLVMARKPR